MVLNLAVLRRGYGVASVGIAGIAHKKEYVGETDRPGKLIDRETD